MSRLAQPPPTERRLVSVLFIDLEGFTRLVEQLDPEDARTIQAQYFAVVRSIVERYGGTIEKYIGDAVMAVWGAPLARDDDGERAVRAALAAVHAVGDLESPEIVGPLRARAAVATGEAAVGPAIDGQGMLVGDPVNTAARLQAVAPVGAVLVDEPTRLLARRALRFESAGNVQLKGKSQALATWRVSGPIRSAGFARRAGHGGSFVGRHPELAALLQAYDQVVHGESRLVSVVGIAGMGKTRVRLELEDALASRNPPPMVLSAFGPAYGEGRPFATLADIVRRWAGVGARAAGTAALTRVTRALDGLADADEASWLAPRLAALLQPDLGSGFEQHELFAAWRRLFERLAARQPTVLLLDDLHRADQGMLEFVEYLAGWAAGHRLMIVAFVRPEMFDARPDWAAEVRRADRISLEPLPDEPMTELLVGLAPDMSRSSASLIARRAGGVPLYAVEFVRLRQEGSAIDPVQLPETLRSLIAARIDALPTAERRVLLKASALGRRMEADSLAAVAQLEPDELGLRLAGLAERQLLVLDDDPQATDRTQLAFVQDLVRDVAYRTLARAERRVLHLAAADHLANHRPSLVEEIAEHLYRSHVAAPEHPQAADVAGRALGALRAAAERATALHVPARALNHLERALELVTVEEHRLDVLSAAASAARGAARFDRAEELLRASIEAHLSRGETLVAARERAQLASLMLTTERHEPALQELEAALGDMGDLDADPAAAELAGQLARAKVLLGDDEQALMWAERAMGAARSLDLPTIHIDALTTRGTARLRLGDEGSGLVDLRRAISAAGRRGLARAELRARNNLAWLMVLDDPHITLETARQGMALADRMGLGDMHLQLAQVCSLVAIDTGDWDEALSVIDEVREQPQAVAHRIQFAATEATIRGLRGERRPDRALAALQPLPADTDPQMVAAVDLAHAWIRFAGGRFASARDAARRAAAALLGAERQGAQVLAIRAELWLGNGAAVGKGLGQLPAEAWRGRVAAASLHTLGAGAAALNGATGAAEMYERVVAEWRELRLPLQLALCLSERHRLLGISRDEAEAILLELRAGALIERLG